jgi:hypothetical protein
VKWLRDNWWVVLTIVLAAAVVAGPRLWVPAWDLVRPSPPRFTVRATAERGEACGPSFGGGGILVEHSVLEVAIDNQSERDLLLARVRIVPGWMTGGFYTGDAAPGQAYDVLIDEWMAMLLIAKGLSDKREAGQAALVDKGYARRQETPGEPIWWVKPEPIEVKFPAHNHMIKRRSQERFRVRVGLHASTDVLEGPVHVEVQPDAGPPVKSEWLSLAVCTPAPPKPPAPKSK